MKIRYGFVTNSSSSSFIIAKKANVDKARLIQTILNSSSLNDVISEFDYLEKDDYIDDAYQNNDPNFKNMLAEYLANELLNFVTSPYSTGMQLDDWNVNGGETVCDTEDLFEFFVSNTGSIELDDFKVLTT